MCSSAFPVETGARLSNKNLIISIHIPKTGGTTFVEALRKCAQEVFYLDYGAEPLAPTALFRRGELMTAPFESIISDLELLPGRSVIHGHFPVKKYRDLFPNAVYVTWLRDPVERVISNYLYWQRSDIPGDRRWEQVTTHNMSLEQFAELEFARNLQEAFLSSLAVEQFDFIGITEEFDRSLELFRRLFCPDIRLDATIQNDNPNRRGKFYDMDSEVRKKIRLLNERDVHLYVDGVRRFRYLCDQVGL
ncbi:MAG TPA: sulfotransferase family 2 domain-containing protein [Candidatus Udaeobacter sp.]